MAWVKKWYENKRGIISSYLNDLFRIQPIKERTGIRKLVMDFDLIIWGLISCGVNAESWSVLLSYYLQSKLDSQTQMDWDNSVTDRNSYPSYESLKEFLIFRVHTIDEHHEPKLVHKSDASTNSSSKARKSFSVAISKPSCCACRKEQHLLIECSEFKIKTPYQRYLIVKKPVYAWIVLVTNIVVASVVVRLARSVNRNSIPCCTSYLKMVQPLRI